MSGRKQKQLRRAQKLAGKYDAIGRRAGEVLWQLPAEQRIGALVEAVAQNLDGDYDRALDIVTRGIAAGEAELAREGKRLAPGALPRVVTLQRPGE